MRYMRGLAILAMLLSSTLLAAKGTQTIYLATPVRAGNAELPRGICEMSSIAPTGSRVRFQESVLRSLHIANSVANPSAVGSDANGPPRRLEWLLES